MKKNFKFWLLIVLLLCLAGLSYSVQYLQLPISTNQTSSVQLYSLMFLGSKILTVILVLIVLAMLIKKLITYLKAKKEK